MKFILIAFTFEFEFELGNSEQVSEFESKPKHEVKFYGLVLDLFTMPDTSVNTVYTSGYIGHKSGI